MLTAEELDHRIRSLEQWIQIAGRALMGFYNPTLGVFWRDNTDKRNNDPGRSPTSTLRSFSAMVEFKRFLYEEDITEKALHDQTTSALLGVLGKYLTNNPAREEVRKSGANAINNFTDAHLLLATSFVDGLKAVIEQEGSELPVDASSMGLSLDSVVESLCQTLARLKGANLQGDELIHDFITLHVVRALDAYRQPRIDRDDFEARLQERVRNDVLRQLGYHSAKITSRFDPSELTFSIVLLNRFPTPEAPQLTRRAVEAIASSQHEGSWPPARPVFYGTNRLLHIVSYEVALALTELLHLQLANEQQFGAELLATLDGTFEFAQTAYAEVGEECGWVNDHARSEHLVESWTTAIVLTFLIHYRDALMVVRQMDVLRKYNVLSIHCRPTTVWPDLEPLMRRPEAIHLEYADKISDPTDGGALVRTVKTELLKSIAQDPVFRPRRASLILYGAPGTRKTSLVRRVAESLGWPLLTIAPPDFLKNNGLDGFESAAALIFEDLSRLRRVVVLFDECEDFFKKRPAEQNVESRTIGAFITAGMLPRLQSLRDGRWVTFVLATNSTLAELDDAVTRQGRFDWAHEMTHPTPDARERYLRERTKGRPLEDDILKALAEFHAANTDKAVSFSHLDHLLEVVGDLSKGDSQVILRRLGEIVADTGPTRFVKTP